MRARIENKLTTHKMAMKMGFWRNAVQARPVNMRRAATVQTFQ